MIAADTSTWIAYFQGAAGTDVTGLEQALRDHLLVLVPAVATELLSHPGLTEAQRAGLLQLPVLEIGPGYWERAGELRRQVLAQGRKARLGDTLIAQCCVDHAVALLTRDRDFMNFAAAAGLRAVLHA